MLTVLPTRSCTSCGLNLASGSIRCGTCNQTVSALLICNSCEAAAMAPGQEVPGQPGYCPECLSASIEGLSSEPENVEAALCPACGEGTYSPNGLGYPVHIRTATRGCPVLFGLDPIPGPCPECREGRHDHGCLTACGCRKKAHPDLRPWRAGEAAVCRPDVWCPCGTRWVKHSSIGCWDCGCTIAERPDWAAAWGIEHGYERPGSGANPSS